MHEWDLGMRLHDISLVVIVPFDLVTYVVLIEMAARQMFTRVIQRMGLTADTPVGEE